MAQALMNALLWAVQDASRRREYSSWYMAGLRGRSLWLDQKGRKTSATAWIEQLCGMVRPLTISTALVAFLWHGLGSG